MTTTASTNRISQYLDEHRTPFRVIDHPAAASADEYHETLGTRYEQQAKSLFIRHKSEADKGFAILALQAQKRADLQRVASLLGAREARLATGEQLADATGCGFGELPPFGRLYGVRLLLDRDLLSEPEIFFNAGDLCTSIAMSPADLADLEKPLMY
jgi:Ala-tRNA(Pro) deacylase